MIRIRTVRFAAFAALLGVEACATGGGAPPASSGPPPASAAPPALPAEVMAQVRKAEALGRTQYIIDKASAIGTDVLLEHVDRSRVGGWLTVGNADEAGNPQPGYTVLFRTREDPPRIAYRVAGTTKPGELVFGLHHRVMISEDGARVVAAVPLSKTALVVRDRDLPPGATPMASVVSHIMTDWPLETHVMVSLMHHNRPVFVLTRLGEWRVVGDKIDYLGPPPH